MDAPQKWEEKQESETAQQKVVAPHIRMKHGNWLFVDLENWLFVDLGIW